MGPYLVALDSSPRAPAVLIAAIRLAAATSTDLILLRAVGLPGDLPVEAYAMSPQDVVGVLQQRAERELKELAHSIPEPIQYQTRVVIGTASQVICELAKASNASLVILGSHGYSGIERLLGTTAARVVNHADRSVLVVRHGELLEPR